MAEFPHLRDTAGHGAPIPAQLGQRAERPDLIHGDVEVHWVVAQQADFALPILDVPPRQSLITLLETRRALLDRIQQLLRLALATLMPHQAIGEARRIRGAGDVGGMLPGRRKRWVDC